MPTPALRIETDGPLRVIAIDRPQKRNAVDPETAAALYDAFRDFDSDPDVAAAILTGTGGAFCAGADLARAAGGGYDAAWRRRMAIGDAADLDAAPRPAPMGPTRLRLSKPVIAAIAGPAVAGGMELALWCDLRVMEATAFMGVFCRRWGAPLIDGGAIRLPRIVGQGRALDLILTGRRVDADEALAMGLADRIAPHGGGLDAARALAHDIARFPQVCLRADRALALDQWALPMTAAHAREWRSIAALDAEGRDGAARFRAGKGRGGDFTDI